MAAYDFKAQRLYVDAPLDAGAQVALSREQSHYVLSVLRLAAGDPLLLFNGRDGEWLARVGQAGRRDAVMAVEEQTRGQTARCDLHYLFAPLKQARLDYMVQKAVEMGAGELRPVITRHTQVSRINHDRLRANAVEAAEQCGVLSVPDVRDEARLDKVLDAWPADRLLVFCDEDAPVADPVAALAGVPRGPMAVLVGPEGGFSPEERDRLLRVPHLLRLSLGPRILRADTAAVAALALVQAVRGDWTGSGGRG